VDHHYCLLNDVRCAVTAEGEVQHVESGTVATGRPPDIATQVDTNGAPRDIDLGIITDIEPQKTNG